MSLQETHSRFDTTGSTRISVTAFLTVLVAAAGLHTLKMVTTDEVITLVGLGLLASISLYLIGRIAGHRAHA